MIIFDLLFPRKCHLCGEELADGERFICGLCLYKLPRTLYHALPLNPMEEKLAGGPPFVRGTGHFFYSHGSGAARLVYDFKYNGYPSLAREMGRIIGNELLPTGFFAGVEVLQPVVMHPLRKARRGYNQAEMIACGVSVATGIPMGDNLRTTRLHSTQTRKGKDEREENMKGYFRAFHSEELIDKGVMLVDDVCTTGATFRNAAAALADIPGISIYYLAMACV